MVRQGVHLDVRQRVVRDVRRVWLRLERLLATWWSQPEPVQALRPVRGLPEALLLEAELRRLAAPGERLALVPEAGPLAVSSRQGPLDVQLAAGRAFALRVASRVRPGVRLQGAHGVRRAGLARRAERACRVRHGSVLPERAVRLRVAQQGGQQGQREPPVALGVALLPAEAASQAVQLAALRGGLARLLEAVKGGLVRLLAVVQDALVRLQPADAAPAGGLRLRADLPGDAGGLRDDPPAGQPAPSRGAHAVLVRQARVAQPAPMSVRSSQRAQVGDLLSSAVFPGHD